jgi:tetrahydromethanopterin S-methyltransferase subunit G
MDDKELLIRQSVLLEAVIKKVDSIETKIDLINDEQIRSLDKGQGILQEKVGRLENIIYGAVAVIFIQVVALIFLWIQRKS